LDLPFRHHFRTFSFCILFGFRRHFTSRFALRLRVFITFAFSFVCVLSHMHSRITVRYPSFTRIVCVLPGPRHVSFAWIAVLDLFARTGWVAHAFTCTARFVRCILPSLLFAFCVTSSFTPAAFPCFCSLTHNLLSSFRFTHCVSFVTFAFHCVLSALRLPSFAFLLAALPFCAFILRGIYVYGATVYHVFCLAFVCVHAVAVHASRVHLVCVCLFFAFRCTNLGYLCAVASSHVCTFVADCPTCARSRLRTPCRTWLSLPYTPVTRFISCHTTAALRIVPHVSPVFAHVYISPFSFPTRCVRCLILRCAFCFRLPFAFHRVCAFSPRVSFSAFGCLSFGYARLPLPLFTLVYVAFTSVPGFMVTSRVCVTTRYVAFHHVLRFTPYLPHTFTTDFHFPVQFTRLFVCVSLLAFTRRIFVPCIRWCCHLFVLPLRARSRLSHRRSFRLLCGSLRLPFSRARFHAFVSRFMHSRGCVLRLCHSHVHCASLPHARSFRCVARSHRVLHVSLALALPLFSRLLRSCVPHDSQIPSLPRSFTFARCISPLRLLPLRTLFSRTFLTWFVPGFTFVHHAVHSRCVAPGCVVRSLRLSFRSRFCVA